MGEIDDQALAVYIKKNFKKKEKKENFHHNKKKDKKPKKTKKDLFEMFDVILVMKRDTWQEIVPSRKGDTMLILSKMMNHQTKDSNERRMLRMKSMC